jgi:exonuclease VII small subunit
MTKKTTVSLSAEIKKLDELIKYFEENNDEFDLDLGINKYEEAMKIVKSVKDELESYDLKIKEIQQKFDADTDEEDQSDLV